MKEFIYYLFSAVSLLFVFWGMLLYGNDTKNKVSKPNMVVIIFLTLINIINSVTYILIVGDFIKGSLSIVGGFANIYVLVSMIRSRNFILLRRDLFVILICVALMTSLFWILNIKDIHLIVQVLNSIGFIPLFIGITDGRGKEPFLPWCLITLGTVCNIVTVSIFYSDYWSLIYPVRLLLFQSIILVLIKYKELKTASF